MANLELGGRPVQGGTPEKLIKAGDIVVNPPEQKIVLQADGILDLSDATDNAIPILSLDTIADQFGGDVMVPTKIWVYAVTAITGTPVITVGTTAFTLAAHAQDDIAFVEVASGSAANAIDNGASAINAACTTAGGGTVKVVVEFVVFK